MDFALFVDAVMQNCQQHPHKVALINAADGSSLTYEELQINIIRIHAWLENKGVCAGDSVIVSATRDFRFIYIYLALHSMGAVAVPLDPQTPVQRYIYIQKHTTPKLTLWPEASMPGSLAIPEVDDLPQKCTVHSQAQASMVADILFTSGTTGEPKGVILTHGNLSYAVNNINLFVGTTADDIEVCPMPLSHSFGIARLRCVLYIGGTHVLEDGVARPKHLFQTIAMTKATGLSMVGPAWRMLRKFSGGRIAEFSNQLRYFELGSAPLTANEKKELAEFLPNTHVCMHYGLTEASRASFLDFHKDSHHLATVGRASPLCEIEIFSPEGVPLAIGEEGEICVRGGMVTSGYLDPQKNENAFFAHGYFRTGDIGKMDEHRYVTLLGRRKDMINVGGEKVSPTEIEEQINTFPGVAASACVGQPDKILGETVVAFLVLENTQKSIDFSALKKHIENRLESYKVPRKFSIIHELPTTPSGKIQHSILKEKLINIDNNS